MSQRCLEPIQSGRLMPCSVAIDLENDEDELIKNAYKAYNAAVAAQPTH